MKVIKMMPNTAGRGRRWRAHLKVLELEGDVASEGLGEELVLVKRRRGEILRHVPKQTSKAHVVYSRRAARNYGIRRRVLGHAGDGGDEVEVAGAGVEDDTVLAAEALEGGGEEWAHVHRVAAHALGRLHRGGAAQAATLAAKEPSRLCRFVITQRRAAAARMAARKYVVAVDVGTGSARAAVFAEGTDESTR